MREFQLLQPRQHLEMHSNPLPLLPPRPLPPRPRDLQTLLPTRARPLDRILHHLAALDPLRVRLAPPLPQLLIAETPRPRRDIYVFPLEPRLRNQREEFHARVRAAARPEEVESENVEIPL